jgi:hypothetical protein
MKNKFWANENDEVFQLVFFTCVIAIILIALTH